MPGCTNGHAVTCVRSKPELTGASTMSISSHAGVPKSHRGRNEQPAGGLCRSGGEPGIPASSRRAPCSDGNEFSSPLVYGWAGSRWICCALATSTSRPAYMTAMRSASSSNSEMSWVMNRIDRPRRCLSSMIWARMSRCTTTSSAVVGSSMMTSSGSAASAIAIMTRCRMPPDSSCG